MKKILSAVLCAVLIAATVLSLSSCNGSGKKYTVGICQLAVHPALDEATRGFKEALVAELGEENVTFDYQNASGDIAVCPTIVNNFVSKNVDLIMANATPALQAAVNATSTIPILATSITEYGVALGLKDFNGTTGINVSGTSDLAPLDTQAQMIIDLFPGVQKVALLYCSAEQNSKYQVDVVKTYLESKGLTATLFSFSDSNDIQAVCNAAAAASDVIYVPTDNTAANSADLINTISRETKTPVLAGEEGICTKCGTFTLSISYYQIGYKTGVMAAKILRDGADISKMQIEYDPQPVKMYNEENCNFFGLTVPEGFKKIETSAN